MGTVVATLLKRKHIMTLVMLIFISLAVLCAESFQNAPIAPCPGEGPRYGDFKCSHDRTHRVCAKLVDNSTSCKELSWNQEGSSFWDITGQQGWNWKDKVCGEPNPGDSWCICMWATARLIEAVGCENVHIRCDSTDVKYVMSKFKDGGVELGPAHECIKKMCLNEDSGSAAMGMY